MIVTETLRVATIATRLVMFFCYDSAVARLRILSTDHRIAAAVRSIAGKLDTAGSFQCEGVSMVRKVADVMWEMLAKAGVKRCYGIVGDALNPVIDALRRNGKIEFIHVRHEEYGVFAAVAEAYLSGNPVAVCGTAGPGVTHLFNGLMDARKEGAAIIAIAGDVETRLMDTAALEELNPYKFFDTACLYVGRVVNPEQVRAVVTTAIMTAVVDKGPTLISMPGDIAAAHAPDHSSHQIAISPG